MLKVNIFFMLFEELLYVTKELLLLLMLLIFSSVLTSMNSQRFKSGSLSLHHAIPSYISSLQKLIYSMDQLTKISFWNMLRHDKRFSPLFLMEMLLMLVTAFYLDWEDFIKWSILGFLKKISHIEGFNVDHG